jgi:predicted flap endonuclease-1-like 5' DNA nuclease
MIHAAPHTASPFAGTASGPAPQPGQSFPLSKLRGLTLPVRAALKRRGIATCGRLLRAAGGAGDRARLAAEAGIEPGALLALVRQADLARVGGIGTVFGLMLEDLDVHDVPTLAARDPADLHARLAAHNREERLARRSPTPEEVEDWVAQARALPVLVSYECSRRRGRGSRRPSRRRGRRWPPGAAAAARRRARR